MNHIFISYSHKDKGYVQKLKEALQEKGFDVWIDDQIEFSDEWVKVIQKKLDECNAFIVVMSKNSFKSDMVQNEVARAREKKRPIFTLLLNGENWLMVQAKQYVDVTNGSLPPEDFYKKLGKVTPRNTKENEEDNTSDIDIKLRDIRQRLLQWKKTDDLTRLKWEMEKILASIPKDDQPVEAVMLVEEIEGQILQVQKTKSRLSKWPALVTTFVCIVIGISVGYLQVHDHLFSVYFSTSTPVFNTTPVFTPTHIFTATPTFTPTPYICPIQGQTDDETIRKLINAEADASNFKDISTILKIFSPNAVFYDYAPKPPEQWYGPRARYEDNLFRTTEFRGVEHFEISPAGPGITGDTAYYTSGSRGEYRIGAGPWQELKNGSSKTTQYGSEHWILEKNANGCWVIVEMQFNAGDEKFP